MSTGLLTATLSAAGGILSLLLWVWRRSERKAGRLESEVELAWKTADVSESLRREEAKRHKAVEEVLRARVGQAKNELDALITKASKNEKNPALLSAVRDYMDGIFLPDPATQADPKTPVGEVRHPKATGSRRNGKGSS